MSEDIYQEHILDHYESPYHRGEVVAPTVQHQDKNPICGDVIRLQLKINDQQQVTEAWFQGQGCAISQAAASILCEQVEGKTVAELQGMTPHQMLELLRVPLTASRQKCGLLCFKVLKTMLYSLETPTRD